MDKSQSGQHQQGSDLTSGQSQQEQIKQWNDLSPQEQSRYSNRQDYEDRFLSGQGSTTNEGSEQTK